MSVLEYPDITIEHKGQMVSELWIEHWAFLQI